MKNRIMRKPFTLLAIIIFTVIAFLHLYRLIAGWEVIVNTMVIPMWISVAGVILAGGLACMLWYEIGE